MEKLIDVGGMQYGKKEALQLRESVIEMRDTLLTNGEFEATIELSHVIAFMAVTIAIVWGKEEDGKAN